MKAEFWHNKWASGDIGFHLNETNPRLITHFNKLKLNRGSRLFLPLCGKTNDIAWLVDSGYHVIGVELSEIAIKALFNELGIMPDITKKGDFYHFSAKNIDIYVGDFFKLSRDVIGTVDAVFDRAALVALPKPLRVDYYRHLAKISQLAPQLLITFEYDQLLMSGPPFSVTTQELNTHYQSSYTINAIETVTIEGGFKGKVPATESVWLLEKAT